MNYWIARKPDLVLEVLRRVDVALLNEEEARALAGESLLVRAADRLLEQGARSVIIKKGEHGALLYTRKSIAIIPAFPIRKVVDPTGAGDSYAGAFMGYLAREGRVTEKILREALLNASAVASFGVEDFSCNRFERLTSADIRKRVADLRRMLP